MEGIESFDYAKNMARVATGFADGPFFKNPVLQPMRSFTEYPNEVKEKLMGGSLTKSTPSDPWVERRSNAKL